MPHLILSNPTTNSCNYEIYLSNYFNQTYYKQVRITSTNHGAETSNVPSYVVSKTAPSSGTDRYVRGIIDNGMSPGRTYTLYAYAQAQNSTWYLAGSDTITTKSEQAVKISRVFNSFNQRNPNTVPSLEGRCYECALACAVSFALQSEIHPNNLSSTATYTVNTVTKTSASDMVNEIIASIDSGVPILAHYYVKNYEEHWCLVYGYNTGIFANMNFSTPEKIFKTYEYLYVKDSVTNQVDINDTYGYDTTLGRAMALSINGSASKGYLSKTINECRYVTNVKFK